MSRGGYIRKAAVVLAALLILGTSSAAQAASDPAAGISRFSRTFFDVFDTSVTVTAYCGTEEEFDALFTAAEDVFVRYSRLLDIYHTYHGTVNLKTVNDSAGIAPVSVPAEIIGFLEYAESVFETTDGRVNIAMGSVIRLWHDAREFSLAFPSTPILPRPEELAEAGRHVSISSLVIDRENGTVFVSDPSASLDVGALAKGYATELAAAELERNGFSRFAINAGGNIRISGPKPGGEGWRVAVTNPDRTSREPYIGSVCVSDCAVVTSGCYQRFFSVDGRCYHHIIDRDTLFPEERYRSVTVICPDSASADAWSTALFNMPIEEGMRIVEGTGGLEAMWVDFDYGLHFSEGFSAVYSPQA